MKAFLSVRAFFLLSVMQSSGLTGNLICGFLFIGFTIFRGFTSLNSRTFVCLTTLPLKLQGKVR